MEINIRRFKIIAISICLSFLFSFNTYAINKMSILGAKSKITFIATQNNAPIKADFSDFSGTIFFSPDDLENSKVDIMIDINSITAPFAELKEMLITNDWFNTKLYPKAKFVSNKFMHISKDVYQATGLLTLKNIKATVLVKFKVTSLSDNEIKLLGRVKINRLKFNIGLGEWSSTKEVANRVLIKFSLIANKI